MKIIVRKCVCLCSFVWVSWAHVCAVNSVWPWFWFTKHCQRDVMNSCACASVCECLCECVCGSVQGYVLVKANKIWHPAPHPVQHVFTNTNTSEGIHVPNMRTHKPCNMQTCVYSLSCEQDPRGCLLGSLGSALRDVISQFRGRWGEKQEESRRELVQQEHYPKEPLLCWSRRGFNSCSPGVLMSVNLVGKKLIAVDIEPTYVNINSLTKTILLFSLKWFYWNRWKFEMYGWGLKLVDEEGGVGGRGCVRNEEALEGWIDEEPGGWDSWWGHISMSTWLHHPPALLRWKCRRRQTVWETGSNHRGHTPEFSRGNQPLSHSAVCCALYLLIQMQEEWLSVWKTIQTPMQTHPLHEEADLF